MAKGPGEPEEDSMLGYLVNVVFTLIMLAAIVVLLIEYI